jgi:uncharacterized membrane protein
VLDCIMKRSLQEIVELVVFGLIALLLATGLLWVVGWLFGLLGTLFVWLAGVIWALLRFIVPVALVAGIVYFLVRTVQGGSTDRSRTAPSQPTVATVPPTAEAPPSPAAPPAAATSSVERVGQDSAPPAPAPHDASDATTAVGVDGVNRSTSEVPLADEPRSGAPEGGTAGVKPEKGEVDERRDG